MKGKYVQKKKSRGRWESHLPLFALPLHSRRCSMSWNGGFRRNDTQDELLIPISKGMERVMGIQPAAILSWFPHVCARALYI